MDPFSSLPHPKVCVKWKHMTAADACPAGWNYYTSHHGTLQKLDGATGGICCTTDIPSTFGPTTTNISIPYSDTHADTFSDPVTQTEYATISFASVDESNRTGCDSTPTAMPDGWRVARMTSSLPGASQQLLGAMQVLLNSC